MFVNLSLTNYGFLKQVVVEYHHCCHRFHDGHRSGQHARVMSTASFHRGGIAFKVDGRLLLKDGRHGFESHSEIDVLAVAHATLDTTAVVRRSHHLARFVRKRVVEFAATAQCAGEAFAIFEAFHRIDAEHGTSQGGMQLVELRLAHPGGATGHHARDDAADGVA